METNTKQPLPLYKVLNGKRTQGNFEVKAHGQYANGKEFIINDKCIFSMFNQRGTDSEGEANAQYTALAVNNLANLAEALQLAMSIIDRMDDEYREATNKHSSYTRGEDNRLKEALTRIS